MAPRRMPPRTKTLAPRSVVPICDTTTLKHEPLEFTELQTGSTGPPPQAFLGSEAPNSHQRAALTVHHTGVQDTKRLLAIWRLVEAAVDRFHRPRGHQGHHSRPLRRPRALHGCGEALQQGTALVAGDEEVNGGRAQGLQPCAGAQLLLPQESGDLLGQRAAEAK